jgi:arginine-tRNA-protein transferase
MIYSFFAAEEDGGRPGMGNFIIMDHITRARDAGLPYVYLGYWVKGSARMAYKVRYRPIEALGSAGWRLLREDETTPAE